MRGNEVLKHLVGDDQFTAGWDDVEAVGGPRLAAGQQVGPRFGDISG